MRGAAGEMVAAGVAHRRQAMLPARLGALLRLLPQLSRYGAVSAIALALDFGLYLVLTLLAVLPALAGAVGYSAGIVVHYLLSCRLVFVSEGIGKSSTRLFVEFAVSGLLGLALTNAIIHVATAWLAVPVLAAKLAAVAVSFVAVFLLRRNVVFRSAGGSRS